MKIIGHFVYIDDSNRSYFNRNIEKMFKTEEEAENKINELKLVAEKKELLKKYEKELNKKLGITGSII